MSVNQKFWERGKKILLIGDIERVFPSSITDNRAALEYHYDVPSGIKAAEQQEYQAIGVVMAGTAELNSALQALRKADPTARIILLAQMYEEPQAMQLVNSGRNGSSMADEYLICPVCAEEFYSFVLLSEGRGAESAKKSAGYDLAKDRKIKILEKLATTDELTGLKNRRYVMEFCRQIIEHVKQRNGRVTVLMFDLDDFKQYNDVVGHLAGDEILRQVAVLLNRCSRSHDIVGRIGGDEFVVIFWDDPKIISAQVESERRSLQKEHPREAIFITRRLQRELKRAELPLLGPEGRGVLTISGGLASFPRDGSTADELFAQVDRALLEAKKSGKNRIYIVGGTDNDIANIE
jgi:diguanylate cyclase (GGDEF)-like protein